MRHSGRLLPALIYPRSTNTGSTNRLTAMDENTAERLELKIAFLERASAELSDVVYAQQRQIEMLQARLVALAGRLEALASSAPSPSLEDERPPHY